MRVEDGGFDRNAVRGADRQLRAGVRAPSTREGRRHTAIGESHRSRGGKGPRRWRASSRDGKPLVEG